jgi:hypothetical protein
MLKYYIFIFILLIKTSFAHNEYYKVENWFLSPTTDLNNALRWGSYSNLRVNQDFPFGSYPPWLINLETKFSEALSEWGNAVSSVHFILNTNDGVQAFFDNDIRYFGDPVTWAGVATSCVAGGRFVNSCSFIDAEVMDPVWPGSPWVTQARVVFNNTSSFGYVWSDANNVPSTELSFKYVVMHEFGHILGLAHCTVYNSSVMWANLSLGNGNQIINHDISGLSNLVITNPATQLEINLLNRFLNRENFLFDYEPEIILYSQKKTYNTENNEEDSSQDKSSPELKGYLEKKLFTKPVNN